MNAGFIVDYVEQGCTKTYAYSDVKSFLIDCHHLKNNDLEVGKVLLDGEELKEFEWLSGYPNQPIETMHDVKHFCRLYMDDEPVSHKRASDTIMTLLLTKGHVYDNYKYWIENYFEKQKSVQKRISFLKELYGYESCNYCEFRSGYIAKHIVDQSKGISVTWREDGNLYKDVIEWSMIANHIDGMLIKGTYTLLDKTSWIINFVEDNNQLPGQYNITDWLS